MKAVSKEERYILMFKSRKDTPQATIHQQRRISGLWRMIFHCCGHSPMCQKSPKTQKHILRSVYQQIKNFPTANEHKSIGDLKNLIIQVIGAAFGTARIPFPKTLHLKRILTLVLRAIN
jgi:hypothetical protein